MTEYVLDYEKRWVTLGTLIEKELEYGSNDIHFEKTVLRKVMRLMESINQAELKIKNKRESKE